MWFDDLDLLFRELNDDLLLWECSYPNCHALALAHPKQ